MALSVGNYICIIYIFIGVNGNGGFAEPLKLFKLHPLGTIAIFQVATLRNHCNFSCCTPWFPIN